MTLYEAEARIGGQLNLARNVPGKEEFDETLRYYRRAASRGSASICSSAQRPDARRAGGRRLRRDRRRDRRHAARCPTSPASITPSCASYVDILSGARKAGRRVAVIGAGGIGFDVAEFLTSAPQEVAATPAHFQAEWGVDAGIAGRGGLGPLPLVGEGRVGGCARRVPHPYPSPQGRDRRRARS